MLVFTRHLALGDQPNATIIIGHDIEVTIIEVRGDQVRLGVKAPRAVPVHRKEVYLADQQEKARKNGQ